MTISADFITIDVWEHTLAQTPGRRTGQPPRRQPRRASPGASRSIDVFTRPPLENTSVSIWGTRVQANDFAYTAGGHSYAMNRSRELKTHTTGVYVQVRPLASSGCLGLDHIALPELPHTGR